MKRSLLLFSGILVLGLAGPARAASLISLNFTGTLPPAEQQTFSDAAAFWNSVITGYDLVYDAYGITQAHALNIDVSVTDIDGSGGVLGSAGWDQARYYDNNPIGQPTMALWYASHGAMEFDSADVTTMVSSNMFYAVVLHEMAHVLGVGTLWSYETDLNGTTYHLYDPGTGQYDGPNALAAWRSEFDRPDDTYVPVELGGGTGTADGHWNEVDGGAGLTGIVSNLTGMDMRDELMTGWASNAFFLSRATVGTLDDLGYEVDYSKAGVINYIMAPEPSLSALVWLGTLAGMRRRRK